VRVLLTNNTLERRAGTELYVRDVALGLLARGHSPIAYSPALGAVAAELRAATVPVIDSLDALGAPPELIHGHHHLETTEAALRFPRTPTISFCHGWTPWEELPAALPNVVRHVAVDLTCRSRLVDELGIAPGRVRLLYNFVDVGRFPVRPALPARPARALVFSNYADERSVGAVREACARRGVAVEVAGASSAVLERPEDALGGYDLVFAKARCAMEAMAVGCAVVLCDRDGAGPLVTSAGFGPLRELNFGIRALRSPLTAAALGEQIDRYDAADAAEVCRLMRTHGDLQRCLDELVALYEEVLAEPRPDPDFAAMTTAAAAYVRSLSPRLKGADEARARLLADLARAEARAAALAAQVGRLGREPGVRLQVALTRLPLLGGLVSALGRRLRPILKAPER
jgi:hypothetical protein